MRSVRGVRKHPHKPEPSACSDAAVTAIQRAPSALFWPAESTALPFSCQKSPLGGKRMCLQQSHFTYEKTTMMTKQVEVVSHESTSAFRKPP